MSTGGPVSRRTLLRAAGGAAIAGTGALATGCSSGHSDALRVVAIGSAADAATWKVLLDAFHKQQPNIRVEPVFLAGPTGADQWTGFFSAVMTRVVGGEKYDLVYVPTEGQLLFSSRNIMQPLDEYARRDAAAIRDFENDTDPKVLAQFQAHRPKDGKTYYYPFGQNTVALMYYKPAFKAAGIPEPTADWDWEKFRSVAHDLHRRTGAFSMSFGTDMWSFGPWLLTNGASILDTSWARAELNSKAALESLTFARSFVADKLTPPPGGKYDQVSAMTRGQLAMAADSRPAVAAMRARKVDPASFGYVPFPKKVRHGTSVGYGALGMFKVSERKEQAWEFIKFTLSSAFQQVQGSAVFQGTSPVRRSAATGPATLDDSPSGTSYLYDGLSYSTLVPGVPNQGKLADPFSKTLVQVLTGTMTPADGLHQLQLQFSANLHH